MKATELRIGNYVWDDYSGEMIVWAISNNINTPLSDIGLKKKAHLPSGGYKIKNIAPIPLTEQWLKDFGFKEVKGNAWAIMYRELDVFKIYCRDKKYFRYILNDFMEIKLESVHQLMNLFFALTNIELVK